MRISHVFIVALIVGLLALGTTIAISRLMLHQSAPPITGWYERRAASSEWEYRLEGKKVCDLSKVPNKEAWLLDCNGGFVQAYRSAEEAKAEVDWVEKALKGGVAR